MNISDLLKGKIVNVMTDTKVIVQLVIESVEETKHSEDLAPATKENDWWPPSRDWITYDIKFTNGYTKSYHSLSEIDIVK
jgi:hypothetical protein